MLKNGANTHMLQKVTAKRNIPNWMPNDDDYELVFMEVYNGIDRFEMREVGHNIPKYNNMLLCDYLDELGLYVPDYTQFLRVVNPEYHFEYRAYGGRVRIDYEKRKDIE